MEEQMLTWSLQELKWALQALALPADAQRNLFPSFVHAPDELALDLDHWRQTAVRQHDFTVDQLTALTSVDALLSQMSGAKSANNWTDSALADDPCWQEVRERARQALGMPIPMSPVTLANAVRDQRLGSAAAILKSLG